MANSKIGRPTKERTALLRNQVSYLLWNEKLETTLAKAKSVRSQAEKLITLAINSYEDTVKVVKKVKNDKGVAVNQEFVNDGPKKLNARRKMMSYLYDIQEVKGDKESKASFRAKTKDINHPLIEKMFNVYAPKYAKRAAELGQGGGYTRIVKLGERRGDDAERALIELV